jgi:hypothetical protein
MSAKWTDIINCLSNLTLAVCACWALYYSKQTIFLDEHDRKLKALKTEFGTIPDIENFKKRVADAVVVQGYDEGEVLEVARSVWRDYKRDIQAANNIIAAIKIEIQARPIQNTKF